MLHNFWTICMKKATLPERVKASRNIEQYKAELFRLGYFESFADGFYSEVFLGKKDVIKIAFDDPAYDAYLEYVLAHQNNPYFPKIYSVHRYNNVPRWHDNSGKANITVVKMERLTPGSMKARRTTSNMLKKAGKEAQWRHPLSIDGRHERQVSKILGELFSRHREDLHSGNVMFRHGHAVVIDPVAPISSGPTW